RVTNRDARHQGDPIFFIFFLPLSSGISSWTFPNVLGLPTQIRLHTLPLLTEISLVSGHLRCGLPTRPVFTITPALRRVSIPSSQRIQRLSSVSMHQVRTGPGE